MVVNILYTDHFFGVQWSYLVYTKLCTQPWFAALTNGTLVGSERKYLFPRRCGAKDSWKLSSALPQGTWRWLQRLAPLVWRERFGATPRFRSAHLSTHSSKHFKTLGPVWTWTLIWSWILFACHFFGKQRVKTRHLQMIPIPAWSIISYISSYFEKFFKKKIRQSQDALSTASFRASCARRNVDKMSWMAPSWDDEQNLYSEKIHSKTKTPKKIFPRKSQGCSPSQLVPEFWHSWSLLSVDQGGDFTNMNGTGGRSIYGSSLCFLR